MSQNDTKKREKAAQLVAEDHFSDEKIAEELEITRRTLARWKENPLFVARVEAIAAAYAKRALRRGIARKNAA